MAQGTLPPSQSSLFGLDDLEGGDFGGIDRPAGIVRFPHLPIDPVPGFESGEIQSVFAAVSRLFPFNLIVGDELERNFGNRDFI